MARRRFQVDTLTGSRVVLSRSESKHAIKVLRLRPGDTITLFDGRGLEAVGRIEDTCGDIVRATLIEVVTTVVERSPALELTVAMPKGERADWLVEKCAELAVAVLRPLNCRRTVTTPGESRVERWRRKAIEAAKQSGQARVLRIESPLGLDDILRAVGQCDIAWYGETRHDARTLLSALDSAVAARAVMLLVGPEGGFTEEETGAMQAAGIAPVRWADSVLRIETAAVAAAAVFTAWKQSRPSDFDDAADAP